MTHNLLLGCFESLWHYGLPTESLNYSTSYSQLSFSSATPTPSTCSPNPVTDTSACCSSRSTCPVTDEPSLLINASQASSLQRLFNVLDEDGDGRLCLSEMCSLVDKLGMSCSHSHNLLSPIHSKLLDCTLINQHQQAVSSTLVHEDLPSLDFPQFAQLYASLSNAASQDCPTTANPSYQSDQDVFDDELLDAFHVYDTNRDGFITADELAAVLLKLGLLPTSGHDQHRGIDEHNLGTCQAYIHSVDLDGNGMVDLQEFKAMMMMHSNPPTISPRCTACSSNISQCAAARVKPGQLYALTCRT